MRARSRAREGCENVSLRPNTFSSERGRQREGERETERKKEREGERETGVVYGDV